MQRQKIYCDNFAVFPLQAFRLKTSNESYFTAGLDLFRIYKVNLWKK
jgi:hypothetical protein